jgi:hypothetical protein
MNVQPGYDPEKRCVTLNVESNLLRKYFSNFSGMIVDDPGVPKNTEVTQIDEVTAQISFPIDDKSVVKMVTDNKMSIGIDPSSLSVFQTIINSFIGSALKKELKTTEFIPLYGYPKENLKVDIQEAVKNKRKLCIIKDYSEYLEMSEGKTNKYIFHQIFVEFGTHEYTEAAILLYNEKLEELREMFEDSLKLEDWC